MIGRVPLLIALAAALTAAETPDGATAGTAAVEPAEPAVGETGETGDAAETAETAETGETGETGDAADAADAAETAGTAAGRLIAAAWEQVDSANWLGAVRRFEEADALEDASDAQRAMARYGLAYCWQNRPRNTDLKLATQLYLEVINEFDAPRIEPQALMALARIYDMPVEQSKREIDKACELYRRLRANHQDHILADEATLWLGSHELGKAQDDPEAEEKAIQTYYLDWLAERPRCIYAPAMYNLVARTYARRARRADSRARLSDKDAVRSDLVEKATANWRTALDYYDRVVAADAAVAERLLTDQVRLGISKRAARIAELRLADYETALRWYTVIAEELPDSSWRFAARQGVARCLEALGRPVPQTDAEAQAGTEGADDE